MTDKTQGHDPDAAPDAVRDDLGSAERQRKIDSDVGLSPAAEQRGGGALANLGRPKASELFRE